MIKKNINCMICNGKRLETFIDLGRQPNGNHFPLPENFETEPTFPFAMAVCKDCWEVQIVEYPSVEFMFSNHSYITGVNKPVIKHFEIMVKNTLEKFPIEKNSLVIDIGANDGTLLQIFQRNGMRVLGVDPGKPTGLLAKEKGITVCEKFWNSETARSIKKLNLRPDLISATAVFYHVEDIHSFVSGLASVMHDKSIFMTQCVHMKEVIEKFQFDHFYHEHTMIHTLGPLKKLFEKYGLRMIDVDFYDVHGGSFVLYVAKEKSKYITSPAIAKAINAEIKARLNKIETYHNFTLQVNANRIELKAKLCELVKEGKKIYALGAPLKGSTLLNYCDIGPELVVHATEVNKLKIGRFTPGTHIPIVDENTITDDPDYYLVLSWNLLDFFIEKYEKFLQQGGKFIIPHPKVKIIDYKTKQ